MKKCFKKTLSGILATAMLFSSVVFVPTTVSAAGFTTVGGWNESLYAEWQDSNPDSAAVEVGYKLSSDTNYTYLSGDDLTYLVRPASTSGFGRVDIPGLKEGRYDIVVKSSNGTEYTRNGVKVYANDRSGYAHWNNTEGIGGYKNDGTPKDNAIVIYVTDENKDSIEIPGYEGKSWNYTPSSGSPYDRNGVGIGNILNNNMKLIQEVTITDNHPLIFRFVGEVNVPKNLTPHGEKDPILGGSTSDNGNLAITKYGRNITLEGIGDNASIEGWGFTFSQTSTCPKESGKSFEVSNLTFRNYPEDALAFQGDDAITSPIERVWVHNNTFYPGYCSNPTESDKKEGDGSCDFKRGLYYTMSYNHYIGCHKTNLLGAGDGDDQFYMTIHHNWYESVESRQPLGAGGNVHIYNNYFDKAGSTTIDLRGKAAAFSEANYFNDCKNAYKTRKSTSNIKTYNDYLTAKSTIGDMAGKMTVATTRDQAGIPDNGLKFPNGDSLTNYDTNPTHFYYDASNKVSDVEVLNDVMDVPEYVMAHAGIMQPYEESESGEIVITVKSGNTPITGAKLTASGLTFKEQGNGVYSAAASIGATYTIVVSKEGYSNVTINTEAIDVDGGVFTAEANLAVDTDGYAVVKLVGGVDEYPVKGATVVLNDGTTLVDQNDGTYKSSKELPVGSYKAKITNTGDYIAPSSDVNVMVKTTDEETVIKLDMYKGTVNVTIAPAEGETEPFDAAGATIRVGSTTLTYNNGIYTGQVEVNTPFEVTVAKPGWDVLTISAETVTADKDTPVDVNVTLKYKGAHTMWNYTDDTNTLNASVTANDWKDAAKYPQEFEGLTLTKAVKMESSTKISFNTDMDGELYLVTYYNGTADNPTVKVDNEVFTVNTSGAQKIDIKAGDHLIEKGTSSTYIYLIQFVGGGSSPVVTTTTETTTESTTKATTTETTTKATTESTTKATTTEATTEAPTNPPVSGVQLSVEGVKTSVGTQVVVPVKLTGVSTLASYNLKIKYSVNNITVNSVTAGDMITDSNAVMSFDVRNGIVSVAGSNPMDTVAEDKDVLFNLVITPNNVGEYTLSAVVDELYVSEGTKADVAVKSGTISVENIIGPVVIKGDADNNGLVNADDVKHILSYVVGNISSVNNTEAADVTKDNKVSSSDAYVIRKYIDSGSWIM